MLYVGCCGIPGGLERYSQEFKTVEINSTFYKLPQTKTAERWRSVVPNDFIFCVKCHQGVTHPIRSPTWRRSGLKEEELERLRGKVGFLRPTKEVLEFWNKTLEICKILKARICLIQLSRSFKENEENLRNAGKFFSRVKRNGVNIALELRGWSKERFAQLCEKFDLIQVVDPLIEMPTYVGKISYFRLHGSYEGGRINYKHRYSDEELRKIKKIVLSVRTKETYVMFNNVFMKEDARRFLELVKTM